MATAASYGSAVPKWDDSISACSLDIRPNPPSLPMILGAYLQWCEQVESRALCKSVKQSLPGAGCQRCLRRVLQMSMIMSCIPCSSSRLPRNRPPLCSNCCMCAHTRPLLPHPPSPGVRLCSQKAHPNDLKHPIGSHKGKGTPGYGHNSGSALLHCAQPQQWSQSRRGSYISHMCSKVGEQCDKL